MNPTYQEALQDCKGQLALLTEGSVASWWTSPVMQGNSLVQGPQPGIAMNSFPTVVLRLIHEQTHLDINACGPLEWGF